MRLWEVRLGSSEGKKVSASSTCPGVPQCQDWVLSRVHQGPQELDPFISLDHWPPGTRDPSFLRISTRVASTLLEQSREPRKQRKKLKSKSEQPGKSAKVWMTARTPWHPRHGPREQMDGAEKNRKSVERLAAFLVVGDPAGPDRRGRHLWNVQARHLKAILSVWTISSCGLKNCPQDGRLWQEYYRTGLEQRCHQTRTWYFRHLKMKERLTVVCGGVWAGSSRKREGKAMPIA